MQLEMILVADGLGSPEGPVAMADGFVPLVEIQRGTLSRVRPDGAIERVAELGGGPDGAVYVCDNGDRFSYCGQVGLTLPGHTPPEHVGQAIQRAAP